MLLQHHSRVAIQDSRRPARKWVSGLRPEIDMKLVWRWALRKNGNLCANSPALILSKNSGVSLAKIGPNRPKLAKKSAKKGEFSFQPLRHWEFTRRARNSISPDFLFRGNFFLWGPAPDAVSHMHREVPYHPHRPGQIFHFWESEGFKWGLSGPISHDIAIISLRYPTSRDTFLGRLGLPQNGPIPPPLVLSFRPAHQCDIPFCNISRDTCAIPIKTRRSFAILSLQVLRDMKSIVAGPLRIGDWVRGALDLQIWGAPSLPPICGKTLVLKGFGGNLRQKWGAQNLQIQHPTDPTPHLPSSQNQLQAKNDIPGFRIFSLLNNERESERKSQGFWLIS